MVRTGERGKTGRDPRGFFWGCSGSFSALWGNAREGEKTGGIARNSEISAANLFPFLPPPPRPQTNAARERPLRAGHAPSRKATPTHIEGLTGGHASFPESHAHPYHTLKGMPRPLPGKPRPLTALIPPLGGHAPLWKPRLFSKIHAQPHCTHKLDHAPFSEATPPLPHGSHAPQRSPPHGSHAPLITSKPAF